MKNKMFKITIGLAFVTLLGLQCLNWVGGLNVNLSDVSGVSPPVMDTTQTLDTTPSNTLPSFLENTRSLNLVQDNIVENTHPFTPLVIPESYKDLALTNDLDLNNIEVSEAEKQYLKDTITKEQDLSELQSTVDSMSEDTTQNSPVESQDSTDTTVEVNTLNEFKSL